MMYSKRLLTLAVAAACSTPMIASATNGDVLIGLGPQSRALGGTGTAAYMGAENTLTNPALLGKAKGSEFAFGGTLFSPNVKAESDIAMPGMASKQTSDAKTNVIPEVSSFSRINDNLVFGIGMWGSAGMGVDYRDTAGLFAATTSLQLMKFAPTLAYNKDKFGFGIAPVIQYGALDINFVDGAGDTVGNGVSSHLGMGYNLGMYYDVNDQLTVGLAYQSAIDMKYKDQITTAADAFGIGPTGMQTITSDHLEQPAELKVGVAYTMNNWMFTGDYKKIAWGSAKGYKDFNWEDQDVYALGVKFNGDGYWVGAGYNFGKDPIDVLKNEASMDGYSNQAVNMFNNHFFPGIVESHYTLGGGIQLNKTITLEGAIVMAGKVDKTVDTGTISGVMGAGCAAGDFACMAAAAAGTPVDLTSHKVTHDQIGYTISVRMNF